MSTDNHEFAEKLVSPQLEGADPREEVLIHFLAWATSQEGTLPLGAKHEVPLAIEAMRKYFEDRPIPDTPEGIRKQFGDEVLTKGDPSGTLAVLLTEAKDPIGKSAVHVEDPETGLVTFGEKTKDGPFGYIVNEILCDRIRDGKWDRWMLRSLVNFARDRLRRQKGKVIVEVLGWVDEDILIPQNVSSATYNGSVAGFTLHRGIEKGRLYLTVRSFG